MHKTIFIVKNGAIKAGFGGSQFGYQSANSVVYFIVIVVISLFQIKVLEKREVQL